MLLMGTWFLSGIRLGRRYYIITALIANHSFSAVVILVGRPSGGIHTPASFEGEIAVMVRSYSGIHLGVVMAMVSSTQRISGSALLPTAKSIVSVSPVIVGSI